MPAATQETTSADSASCGPCLQARILLGRRALRILVTGGAGLIGSHVAERCLDAGHDVAVIDDLSSGKQNNPMRSKPGNLVDVESVRICSSHSWHRQSFPSAVSHYAS
jgi:nucleoside-diphosphate-sugar epimerase